MICTYDMVFAIFDAFLGLLAIILKS